MSDHVINLTDSSSSRFRRFKSWYKSSNPQSEYDPWADSVFFTQNDPRRDHVCRPVIIGPDGRAKPLTPDFFKCQYNHTCKQTRMVVEERMQLKDYEMMNEPKKGFPAGMFQRKRNEYREAQPGLTSEGGWDRPSPAGWKLAHKEALLEGMNGRKKDVITIDSHEAAKRYGGRFSF